MNNFIIEKSLKKYEGNAEKVNISKSIDSIESMAFADLKNLTKIFIPENITNIGNVAFFSCPNLTSIDVDEANPNYSSEDGILFDKNKTVLIKYPEGKAENRYTIPDSVTKIGNWAFSGCSNLTSVDIPSSVTEISEGSFADCINLTNINISYGITEVGMLAFRNCESLTSINIPESLTAIEDAAFQGCKSIKKITIPYSISIIGKWVFFGCSSLTSIDVADENPYYSSEDGILFNEDKSMLIKFPEGKTESYYIIPDTVTEIKETSFSNCSCLTSVTIPNNVKIIRELAFVDCKNLTNIIIPEGIKSIESGAFANCDNLTSINVEDSNLYYSSEDGILFDKDRSFLIQFPEGKTDTIYKISESVKAIGSASFTNCQSLTSIFIPGSIENIETGAFNGCSNLTSINVADTNPHYYSEDGILFNKDKTKIIKYPEGKADAVYTIPDSVTTVTSFASFTNCQSLTSIFIPDSIENIGTGSFGGCSNLTSINVADTNPHYYSEDGILFNKDKTKIIKYPEGKADAVYTIPDSVTTVASLAFENCKNLKNIFVPDSVKTIEKIAFFHLTCSTNIIFPDEIQY